MGKTKRKLSKKQSKKQSRRRRTRAGNNFFHELSKKKTPEEQNKYLRKIVGHLTGNIEGKVQQFFIYKNRRPDDIYNRIKPFLENLAHYEMISYPGGHGFPKPTFIEEIYKNKTKLLKNIEKIEDIHTKYKALHRHGPGTHHHGRTFNKIVQPKRPYAVTKSFSNKNKLSDVVKEMKKNVLPLTDLIKKVIKMQKKKLKNTRRKTI